MRRIGFFVDGFNLYHSLVDAQLANRGRSTKWLSLRSLCVWSLGHLDPSARLVSIHYFSALTEHERERAPGKIARHELYLEALRDEGVSVHLGDFKRRASVTCHACGRSIPGGFEEKQGDVGLAVSVLEQMASGGLDGVAIVSGDTDQIPTIRAYRRMYPESPIFLCLPYHRHSDELSVLATRTLRLKKTHYSSAQFGTPLSLRNGRVLHRPAGW
ncbi:MAG: NYN domain-containing protein [Candidatus Eisenbacteria bacterium]|uniref:NYN domain-containing protein n=1 Tax=Eiseniibacteriota bacterium TaxID=2212470 RepID=A0A933SB97_UNCEI|nr:NYN domain-containing protein [Candidatus Eisenbacteria bacterium]